MKKMIFVLTILLVATSLSFGQFSKGTKAIDGELSILKPSEGDAGMMFSEIGDSEAIIQLGMLSPFMQSSNVHLNPGLQYYTDSEVIAAGASLTILF